MLNKYAACFGINVENCAMCTLLVDRSFSLGVSIWRAIFGVLSILPLPLCVVLS